MNRKPRKAMDLFMQTIPTDEYARKQLGRESGYSRGFNKSTATLLVPKYAPQDYAASLQ
jgi:hypothetical protein